MKGNSWILLLKDGSSLVGGRPRGGVTKHNRTDSCTELICLEMRQGVIITSILAICDGRGVVWHNRTDSCTEIFCLKIRQGVIITSILAICNGRGRGLI